MKKSKVIILIIGCTCCLLLEVAPLVISICLNLFYGSYYYDYQELQKTVISVELIEYNAADARMTRSKKDVGTFDFDKSETLQTLEQDRIDEFIRAFSKIKFFENEGFPNTPIGQCIKLTYTNGDFMVVIGWQKDVHEYCYGAHRYDKGGSMKGIMSLSRLQDFFDLRKKFFGVET